mgnify:CR=1 FL=1
MRAFFIGLAALAAGLPAFACDLALTARGTAVADYVEQVQPCFADLPDGYAFDAHMEQEFLRLVNTARKEEGLSALIYRPALRNTARFHSLDMAYNDFFGHVGPDGREPQDRVSAFDRRAIIQYSAENVAMVEVVRGRWNLKREAVRRLHKNLMESPGHSPPNCRVGTCYRWGRAFRMASAVTSTLPPRAASLARNPAASTPYACLAPL